MRYKELSKDVAEITASHAKQTTEEIVGVKESHTRWCVRSAGRRFANTLVRLGEMDLQEEESI